MSLLIPDNKVLAVRRLAKECASNFTGECAMLDCDCVVENASFTIICKYFVESVLPADPKLHQEVLLASDVKDTTKKYSRTCKQCGQKFKAITKQTLHCEKCQKKLNAIAMKKKRERKRSKVG